MAQKSRITGAKEMARVLKALPPRVAERDLLGAVRVGAGVVKREAVKRAPKSGRGTRKVRGKDRKALQKEIKVTKIASDSKGAAVAVHTGKAFWGMFSEFGTSRQPARPWLSPALDASAVAALGRLGKNLGDRLERTAKELAGRYNALKKSTKRRL